MTGVSQEMMGLGRAFSKRRGEYWEGTVTGRDMALQTERG